MNSTDIVGYTYRADNYCPTCILLELGGIAVPPESEQPNTERVLDCVATVIGIDRYREATFDSGQFPKVVFLSDLDLAEYECCGRCGRSLGV